MTSESKAKFEEPVSKAEGTQQLGTPGFLSLWVYTITRPVTRRPPSPLQPQYNANTQFNYFGLFLTRFASISFQLPL